MKTTKILSALVLALVPCTAFADNEKKADKPAGSAAAPGATAPADEGPPPAEVLTKLHHSNQMEIEAGKLAQEKGESKAVKNYGKMLVRDHTAADKQVTALAKQLKVEFETMPAMKSAKMDAAKNATGAEFDRLFAEAMVEDHTRDASDAAAARDATKNPKLKKLLTALVPKLEKHRDTAQKLASTSGSAAAGAAGTGTAAGAGHGSMPGHGSGAGAPPPSKPPKGETGVPGAVK